MLLRSFKNVNFDLVRKFSITSFNLSSDLLIKEPNEISGITTLSLNRPPVNSLNTELLKEMAEALNEIQSDKTSKGLILTSNLDTVFSGGLDLLEMYNKEEAYLKTFWKSFQDVWLALFSFQLPVVCAINGHAPAGGTVLACCCDYRIMVDGPAKMGLNETKFGFALPFWVVDSMRAVVGHRRAELSVMLGTQYTPAQAMEIGLVDELAKDKDDCILKSSVMIQNFNKSLRPMAVVQAKNQSREKIIEYFCQHRDQEMNQFVEFLLEDQVQKSLEVYVSSLSSKPTKLE